MPAPADVVHGKAEPNFWLRFIVLIQLSKAVSPVPIRWGSNLRGVRQLRFLFGGQVRALDQMGIVPVVREELHRACHRPGEGDCLEVLLSLVG